MNTPFDSLRGRNRRNIIIASGLIGCVLGVIPTAWAGNDTWSGGGQDRSWTTPANWVGGVAPIPGDSLFFGGTVHTGTTNNFPLDTPFSNFTFNSPAGFFTLAGTAANEVALTGNITNNQTVTLQTISLPLLLATTPTVSVVPNGMLSLNGAISGVGGLSLVGGGTVNLNGANPFSGGVSVNNSSTAVIGADTNLGGGSLVLNNGTLSVTTNFTLGAARGIAVGPGWGGINVPSGITNGYGGVVADNGGPGGLTKSGYGTLSLFGANTYSGTTSNTIGTLLLDFTQAGAPAGGIINSNSPLELGGGNAGGGGENVAQLIVDGGTVTDTQNFNGTFATFGGSAIVATNKTGGTVNLGLGALSHAAGGTISFVTPASGHVTTASLNVNGILGGYALISGVTNATTFTDTGHTLILGTNFAAVDGNSNIVNYTGYSNVTSSTTVDSQVAGSSQPNVAIDDTASSTVVNIDNDNAGSTSDINAIRWTTYTNGFDSISIGQGNTLRLGPFGGIIRNGPSTGNAVYIGGPNSTTQSGSGTTGYANIGTLTAGGPNINTRGEIVIVANNASETSGTTIFECGIADNGTGAVTVVKMGPGSIKLDGSNSFSGGLYLLQGRVQIVGGEIGNPNWATGGGSGSIYVLPGAYLFPSGTSGGQSIPNPIFVSGAGDAHEPLGAFRSGEYTGTITLIGDATFGGDAIFDGPIVGPYNLTLGSAATINGGARLNNPANNWTGNTILTARSNTGNNTITCGTNNVIPNGFGYGNVSMTGFSTGTVTFDLAGFNQTINGLSSTGTGTSCLIQNSAAGTVTLTIGNNDQSGTFGGIIRDAAGQTALTKIGGGVETLTGASTYSAATIVNGGTLAFSGSGSIASSASITVNTGATLDITENGSFTTANPVQLTGGTLAGNGSVGPLTMNNGALTLDLNPATTNVTASSLTLAGSSNVVNIGSVVNVTGYPTAFTVIKYAGALSGGLNFVIGSVPNPSTGGFFSNDVAASRIVLVLTNGPAPLTWVGGDPTNPTFWDFATTNWLKFKGTANQATSAFESQDPVIFDDTGDTNQVNLTTNVQPGFITVSNSALNYTISGIGSMGGIASLVKYGTGTLTFLNTGGDSYTRGVVVNAGTVVFGANNAITGGVGISNSATIQVGLNAGAGMLPGGNVDDEGSLIFDAGTNLAVPNNMTGFGTITKQDNAVLTLSGNNGTLAAPISVTGGTLQAGSGNALGTNVTTINSGTTLDVNGQGLNRTALVTASGTGVGGLGAIVNNGAGNQNALGSVTLANNTTFGGINRWDVRGTNALSQLSTSGNAYSLTKVGPNFIGIVNVTVDSALANIDIQQGTLDYEANTTGLGNPSSTLTVENTGGTLELFNAANPLNKIISLNGSGTNDTLLCGNNINNIISGPVTVNGPCWFDATAGAALTFNNTISGGGRVFKIGTGTNTIGSGNTASYTGNTTISNGTLVVDGTLSSSPVLVLAGGQLAGYGTVSSGVTNSGGSISPGDIVGSPQNTLTVGNLTLNTNATEVFELSANTNGGNDLLAAGNLTLLGTNTLQIVPLTFMNVGDVYTLMTYTGPTLTSSATNQFKIQPPNSFSSFSMVDPSTTAGLIQIKVLRGVGNDVWTGAHGTNWDLTTTNWTRNNNPANFNDGDFVTFDDTTSVTNVNIVGARTNSNMAYFSSAQAYSFTGPGSLIGLGGLDFEGSSLTIANAGSNSVAGLIYIAGGTLQLGNGGTNGALAGGVITNNGALVFNRSDTNLVVANAIRGTGSVTNVGTGIVTLTGANTFFGPMTIVQGTLRVLTSASLSNTINGTVISNGATLDITNNANLGRMVITATGAGVGGKGAIVNNSTNGNFVAANFSQLTMTTNIVIGGSGRLDFRASSATAQDANLSSGGANYTFTKVGSNLLQMAGVQIDGALGDIIVNSGTLGFQWQMPSLGNPTNNLVVSNGASIAFFDMSNAVSKNLIFSNNTSVVVTHGVNDEFDGPVTLAGTTTVSVSGGAVMLFANEFSGPGSLVKTGTNALILSLLQTNGGAEIYSGNTYIGQGTLALLDNANLSNSPSIIMTNATLSVTGRVDNTLTVGAAMPQTLAGGGVINGALVVNPGSTINPGNGNSTAVLVVSNATTLNGSVIMDLNIGAAAVTNDEIAAPSFSLSGPLTVTNVGPDLLNGGHFQLFNQAVSGFSSVSLPANNGTPNKLYQWRNDLAVNGSITLTNVVVVAPTTNAAITRAFLAGTNLVIHGTNNNVPNTNFHYLVLTATNITTRLSNWVPLATNSFNSDGTFDFTNPVVPSTPRQFLDVKVVP